MHVGTFVLAAQFPGQGHGEALHRAIRSAEVAEEAGRKRAHAYSFRYLDVWASLVATVESLASREGRGT